ncbi:sporulation peptidase YabG [Thermosinus carboxydivorans]|uniref:sporulation peptidase YabG n=1 Tax=Thermosinus carboxydivorans TaxID=261685 RepID=UPI0002DAAE05|nr:sporulation peptidase YabG [Thermosinus carboxydivorans]
MPISVGDLVIRKSHGGDIVFKVTDIFCDGAGVRHCILKGLHYRLMADAPLDDVQRIDAEHLRNEIIRMESMHNESLKRVMLRRNLEREQREMARAEAVKKFDFFDCPGRVLHIDGDEEYLRMCLKTYSQLNIEAHGKWIEESKQPEMIIPLLQEYRPDILVVTGHDALVGSGKKEQDWRDLNSYRNSKYYIQSVRNARQFEPSRDELVIFAGACQSYFEAILEAGANFASSPTRIFIHAYDPVFIAEKVAFTPINKTVDISDAITASVTGVEGVGGLETRGKFRLGMPKTKIGL